MIAPKIMVVEDEEALGVLLQYNLESEGYQVEVITRGDEAELRLRENLPDLLVLDWMVPAVSGIELCRRLRLRPETERLPIIMLTARGEESDRVRGLATGADDYLVKPFSTPEFIARVRALLRRAKPEVLSSVLKVGEIVLDRETHRVHRAQTEIKLGPTEFRLLEFMMRSISTSAPSTSMSGACARRSTAPAMTSSAPFAVRAMPCRKCESGDPRRPMSRLIPVAYNVGGRHVSKPTGRDRDSSLRISKAPGMCCFCREAQIAKD
jgi:two-component system phosphate regulon response regulator PhoB